MAESAGVPDSAGWVPVKVLVRAWLVASGRSRGQAAPELAFSRAQGGVMSIAGLASLWIEGCVAG